MADSKLHFNTLFFKYCERTASPSEITELYRLFNRTISDEEISALMQKVYQSPEPSAQKIIPLSRDRMLEAIFNNDKNQLQASEMNTADMSFSMVNRWYKYAAAAVVLIGLTAALYLYVNKQADPAENLVTSAANRILPGSNKAILTLADGSQIALDDTKNGVLANQGQTQVRKSAAGQVTYLKNDGGQTPAQHVFNTVSTPRGGQYQIVLPDGTKVWLNSASSLKFPAFFSGNEREVELTGEGYFEVAKNKKMPFHVKIAGVDVEVLGTHFNIMGYGDEQQVKTSLLEGKVKISKGQLNGMLLPGQQAVIGNASQKIDIRTTDLEEAVAWKNGYFMFENESMESVMRKLSRWYNVNIEYRGNFKGVVFSGSISRFEHVAEVLKTLELTDMVHFKIEERRIIVMR